MNGNKIKILFVLPTLTAGGAEKIIAYIAQNINRKYFESYLIIVGHEAEAKYKIKGIEVKFLNKDRVLYAIPALFSVLYSYRPNVVLSSIGHLNTIMGLLSFFFAKTKFAIRESSVISERSKFGKSRKLGNFSGLLSKIAYDQVDCVICQSRDMAEDFKKIYNIPDTKIDIINNPITLTIKPKSKSAISGITKFITIGRLSQEKGHLRVLELLAKLKKPFQYTIIGSGTEKDVIFERIKELNLEDRITHIQHTDDVYQYLKTHDLFLQGSFVEGFPNAVLESCVAGTPVLAFNVPGGTKEIIEHNINGFLVGNEEEFLSCLNSDRKWDPTVIHTTVYEKYNSEKIVGLYENLFKRLLNG
ncbi:N-acetylgalactosamine-N,N'-diacetylbacillosaminyl -diphospho-undecaprenol 4-alpha-N-acetylgalactosaminyltransferase [Flavobacteriaceae bacterium GF1]